MNLQLATEYANGNADLRAAVGACDNECFVLHHLGKGEHNLNYWFQAGRDARKFVLRINVASQPFHANQIAYEFAALEALRGSGCTPEPVYCDDSEEALGKGVLVESFCEGSELDFDHLRPGDVDCAIRLMADVHAVPVDGDCPLYRPEDPLRELYDECVQRYETYRASAYEDARITSWAKRFLAAAEEALGTKCLASDCSHIVNTETLPSHFLVPDDRTGGKGAFVDWERPIIGEVAQDVAYFVSPTTTFWDSEYRFPASEVDRVVEAYWQAVDGRFDRGNFDERFRAWRIMTVLRSVTWCCRALITYGDGMGGLHEPLGGGASRASQRADESREADASQAPLGAGAHTTDKTAKKLPVYLSDEFMEYLVDECL